MLASQVEKNKQLGMNAGTAAHQLRKTILFELIKELKKNVCYQCGKEITSIDELSIEHKVPWLHSAEPKKLFFDYNNIAFSHFTCNINAKRPRVNAHPSVGAYKNGCRCDDCRRLATLERQLERSRAKARECR